MEDSKRTSKYGLSKCGKYVLPTSSLVQFSIQAVSQSVESVLAVAVLVCFVLPFSSICQLVAPAVAHTHPRPLSSRSTSMIFIFAARYSYLVS